MKIIRYLNTALHRLFYKNRVILVKRDTNTHAPNTCIDLNAEFRRVDYHNIGDTVVFEDSKYKKIYEKMLEEGQEGLFGYLDDKCVYRLWGKSTNCLNYDGIYTMQLDTQGVLIHYAYCAPSARGKGIHTEGIRNLCDRFGTYDFYATVAPKNYSSMAGFMRNGFYKYLDITVGYFLLIPYHIVRKIPSAKKHTIIGE